MNHSRAHSVLTGIGLAAVWAVSAWAEPVRGQVERDAGRWRTWAIVSASTINLPGPPDTTATAAEIQDLKTQLARDIVTRDRIAYWDRGWPGYRWQEIALAESQMDQKPMLWRTMALVSAAINDATIATWHEKYKYSRPRPSEVDPALDALVTVPPSPSYPSEHAAVAAAAADVLTYIFPNSAALLKQRSEEAAQSRIAAGVQYPSDVKAGLSLGHQVGAAVIARAKADRSDVAWDGKIKTGPDLWAGTNPRLPTMGTWTPWILASSDQFRPPPPPAPKSPQMAADLAEVKNFQRTPLTRRTAHFWAVVPELREWIAITNQKIFEYRLGDNPPRAARAMALVMIASMDSFIGCFEAKYHYLAPRPFQVDSTIDMLFPAPNHPSYPAAHGCGDGAAEVVLSYLFPQDAGYFRERAEEGAMSRLWAGIHFRSDIDAGMTLGRSVGQLVVTRAKEDEVAN